MTIREDRSMPDEDGSEVVEAVAQLDDESRCLILEHYFEKTTLEELARREGLSVAGIWKRIERAKGMLRRALIGAGFTVSAASLTHALEAVAPVSAPASLIGGAVVSKAALVAAGGFVMASKSAISGTAVVLGLLLMCGVAGGGYWVGSRRASAQDRTRSGNHNAQPGPSTASSSTLPGRTEELVAENERLKLELDALRRLASATSPATKALTLEEKRAYAIKLYDALSRRHGSGVDNQESRDLMKHYHQLDSDVTQIFIDRFMEKSRDAKLDHVALDLILKAGGEDASEFLASRLNNSDISRPEREQLLLKSSGHLGTTNWLLNVPPTPQLESVGAQLVTSADGLERAAGAGILGCFTSPTAHTPLLNCVNGDNDVRVLLASVKSLARSGAPGSLPYLEGLRQRQLADPAISSAELGRAINGAIVAIQLRQQEKK